MHTDNLPQYFVTPVHKALPVMAVPGTNVQMSLSDVSFQIYPLRASMARLTEFCDLFLNFIHENDQPPFFFRPALPYVLVQIINYGRMAIEWQNMGWFAANELCFTVPLECYRKIGNELIFVDWATISPFIFADNPLSVRNGREVYGWPKVAMKMESLTPILDPLQMDLVIRLELEIPGPSGARDTDNTVPFLDVVRGPQPFQSVRRATNDLITAMPNALAGSMSFLSDTARSLADLGSARYQETSDLGYLQAASDLGFQYLRAVAPRIVGQGRGLPYPQPIGYEGNVINLKQFRDAENPDSACYQAITLSRMTLERVNDAGLLVDLKSGDSPSGRFLLRLFQQAIQPIVETLGLEVAGQMVVGDRQVAVLEPQFPFWMNADLSYGQGETLCWRSRCSLWSEEVPSPASPSPHDERIPYVPMGSGALQEIAGPFTFPTLTLRVLPMIANKRQALEKYCADYLPTEMPYKIEPWGSYVYLLAASYDGLTARLNSAGLTADREVAIVVPVKVMRRDGPGHYQLDHVALLPAYTFAGCQVSAITDREVYGRPTLLSELKSPPTTWMYSDGDFERPFRALLEVWTQLLPSDFVGAEAAKRRVIEIGMGRVPPVSDSEGKFLWEWAHTLLNDYRKKVCQGSKEPELKALINAMLQVLFSEFPISSIALKQFMDAADMNKACLQALVQVSRSIDSVHEIGEFEHPLHVSIPSYGTLPIVDDLGLEVKWTTSVWDPAIGNVATDFIEPVRPFWISMAMSSGADSENLCLRAGTEANWHTYKNCEKVPVPSSNSRRRLTFGPGFLETLKNDKTDRPIQDAAGEWLREQLASELYQIRQQLRDENLQQEFRARNIRVRLPDTDLSAAPDDSWAMFVNSLQLEELLQMVDGLEESKPELKIDSNRSTRQNLTDAMDLIDPQVAFEAILNEERIVPPRGEESGGVPYPLRKKVRPRHRAEGLPAYRIRRDSAGLYFAEHHTDWTKPATDAGNECWYWESDGDENQPPEHPEESGRTSSSRSKKRGERSKR